MSDRFEDDLMEDLMAEPEGRSGHSAEEFDEAEEFDAPEQLEASDHIEAPEPLEAAEEFEEAITDALEAEDIDEFFGGFRNVLKTVGRVARKVAPIAKMIPIPQAQIIGGAADLIGNVLADEGDEMDAMDALADFADEEDGFEPLAPAIAGLAIRGALKHKAAKIPREQRRQLVKAVSTVTKHIARKHGPRALAAVPALVSAARRVVLRKRLPVSQLPHVVKRAARAVLRSPRALRKFAAAGAGLRTGRMGYRFGSGRKMGRTGYAPRWYGPGSKPRFGTMYRGGRFAYGTPYRQAGEAVGAYCPSCRSRTLRLRGPVTLTIHSH
jgi:hypothetical protein